MEKNLTEVFKLGRRWGPVVLLDEADVLVAKRTDHELERNAVVASRSSSIPAHPEASF
jgi:hypothetical protein